MVLFWEGVMPIFCKENYLSGTILCLIDIRNGQTCKEDLFGFTDETGLFIYEELVHSIFTL